MPPRQPGEDADSCEAGTTTTSEAKPQRVSWALLAEKEGCDDPIRSKGGVGLTHCPGKVVKAGRDGCEWKRDMRTDISHLKEQHGVTMLVCLLNKPELRTLGASSLEQECNIAGVQFVQFPIIEMGAPECIPEFEELIDLLVDAYSNGGRVVLHCRGGVGRAGTVAACVLLKVGVAGSASQAIALVRRRRCKYAVESRKQEDFVGLYASLLSEAAAAAGAEGTITEDTSTIVQADEPTV
eukprot:TRINITY_DN19343_c0_g1_i3.p1 TRINITY_DN19343_c0_g1~~TRINITY_DN19343_c0_g1_i3.p1  ORF type:complete len:239 (-),score=53.99 TRINITY_DN19343_c0_g1_i3:101-817(-)